MTSPASFIVAVFLFASFAWAPVQAGARPAYLPFDVTLDGQAAVPAGATVARVFKPVPPDAALEVKATVTGMMILNIFPSDENGVPASPGLPGGSEVIMVSGASLTRINQTLSRNPLKPGMYLANIVANGQTSRIVFQVQ